MVQVLELIALHCLEAQAHSRPWVSLRWVRTYCCYSERASRYTSSTYSPVGHHLSIHAFDRDRLDELPWLPNLEVLLGGVHPTGDQAFQRGFGSRSRPGS
jgi:hypothetical protein